MNVSVTQSSLPIPDELIFEIFLRLPLKAIARCRCVSKLWSSMLRSQYFTELFLTKSCARPQLLFAFEDDNEVVLFSSPQPQNLKENSYVVAANYLARFPRYCRFSTTTSGFFCYRADRIFEELENPVCVQVICNPSTGQSLTMPRLNSKMKYGVESYLGYEPISKEFKVLSVRYGCISKELQVLTLGANKLSWRLVECSIPHSPFIYKCICISGVIYYTARVENRSLVACFDLRSEKFSFVKFSKAMPSSATLINYNGKLGLLMSGASIISGSSKSLELWVLRDAGKNEWSKHVYVLPPMWKDVVTGAMLIAGMVGVNEIVLSPIFQEVSFYVIYYNVERETVIRVGIRGTEEFQGKRLYTYLNYVENVKLL